MQVETTMRLLTLVGDDLVRVAPRLIGRARESPWSMPWTGSRLAAFYFGGVEWLGLRPNGGSISFSEHVFYKFRGGKIYEVWSLLDVPSIVEQLS